MIPPTGDPAPVEEVAPVEAPAAEPDAEPIEPPTPVEAPEVAPPAEEIVVWGRLATDQARDAIVRQLEDLGWEVVRRKEGRTVLRGPSAWMGRAELDEDGGFSWGRPVAGFSEMPAEVWVPVADAPFDPNAPPPLVGAGPTFWILPSRSRLDQARTAVVDATRDEVDRYLEIRRRTVSEEQLQALPDRLDALWTSGTPLEPGPPIPEPDARRRAILAYWATRADTPEGRRVSALVETWLREVVQTSPHPITAEERASHVRPDGRTLP